MVTGRCAGVGVEAEVAIVATCVDAGSEVGAGTGAAPDTDTEVLRARAATIADAEVLASGAGTGASYACCEPWRAGGMASAPATAAAGTPTPPDGAVPMANWYTFSKWGWGGWGSWSGGPAPGVIAASSILLSKADLEWVRERLGEPGRELCGLLGREVREDTAPAGAFTAWKLGRRRRPSAAGGLGTPGRSPASPP